MNREPTDEDYRHATQDWNRDREIVKALGLCWHEYSTENMNCIHCREVMWRKDAHNPDFTTDAGKVQLLKEMEKREDWIDLCESLAITGGVDCRGEVLSWFIEDHLIGPDDCKLRDAAWEFLCHKI